MIAGRPSVDIRLERLGMRTLVVAGDEDTVTPPELQQHIMDRMPNALVKTIARAGHLSPLEKPQELISLLREFLRELRDGVRDLRTGRILRKA